jgi:hypothetical protein
LIGSGVGGLTKNTHPSTYVKRPDGVIVGVEMVNFDRSQPLTLHVPSLFDASDLAMAIEMVDIIVWTIN